MRPPEEDRTVLGEPPAVDADHWSALKRSLRADRRRADARECVLEQGTELGR